MLSERLFDYLKTISKAEEPSKIVKPHEIFTKKESEVTIGNNRTLAFTESSYAKKISIRVNLPNIGPTDIFVLKHLKNGHERLIVSTIDRSGEAFDDPHNVFVDVAYGESGDRKYWTGSGSDNDNIKAEIQAELEKQGCPEYENVGDQTIDFAITANRFLTFLKQNKLEQLSKVPIGKLIALPQESVQLESL